MDPRSTKHKSVVFYLTRICLCPNETLEQTKCLLTGAHAPLWWGLSGKNEPQRCAGRCWPLSFRICAHLAVQLKSCWRFWIFPEKRKDELNSFLGWEEFPKPFKKPLDYEKNALSHSGNRVFFFSSWGVDVLEIHGFHWTAMTGNITCHSNGYQPSHMSSQPLKKHNIHISCTRHIWHLSRLL